MLSSDRSRQDFPIRRVKMMSSRRRRAKRIGGHLANGLITAGLLALIVAMYLAFPLIERDSPAARKRLQAITRVWNKIVRGK
jgi:hypothetical protein